MLLKAKVAVIYGAGGASLIALRDFSEAQSFESLALPSDHRLRLNEYERRIANASRVSSAQSKIIDLDRAIVVAFYA